jgi:hypothetical protein
MTAIDLVARYGIMVPLADIASLFHASQQAMRSALDERGVPIFEVGDSTIVPLRMVDEALSLAVLMDEDERHTAAVARAATCPDGSPKPMAEYIAEVDARAGVWLDDIEAARGQAAAVRGTLLDACS